MIAGTKRKFVFYSAHDTTLSTFLSGMSVDTNFAYIPFASTLIYELWENGGEYEVKIKYNDAPANIPACNGSSCSEMSYADLRKFILSRTVENLEEACGGPPDFSFVPASRTEIRDLLAN